MKRIKLGVCRIQSTCVPFYKSGEIVLDENFTTYSQSKKLRRNKYEPSNLPEIIFNDMINNVNKDRIKQQ